MSVASGALGHLSSAVVLLFLQRDEAGWNPLLEAAEHGHAKMVGFLLQNGADVNSGDKVSAVSFSLSAQEGIVILIYYSCPHLLRTTIPEW